MHLTQVRILIQTFINSHSQVIHITVRCITRQNIDFYIVFYNRLCCLQKAKCTGYLLSGETTIKLIDKSDIIDCYVIECNYFNVAIYFVTCPVYILAFQWVPFKQVNCNICFCVDHFYYFIFALHNSVLLFFPFIVLTIWCNLIFISLYKPHLELNGDS